MLLDHCDIGGGDWPAAVVASAITELLPDPVFALWAWPLRLWLSAQADLGPGLRANWHLLPLLL